MKLKSESPTTSDVSVALNEPSKPSGVASVDATLAIIELLAFENKDMGVTEIANRIGMSKASIYRHLVTLVEHRYLVQDLTSARYRWGPRLYLLGRVAPPRFDLAAIATPWMDALREEFGETIVIATPTSEGVVIVKVAPSKHQIQITVAPGTVFTFARSAQGRIADAFRQAVISDSDNRAELSAPEDLKEILQRGWATVNVGSIATVAAAISLDLNLIGTIGMVGDVQHVGGKHLQAQAKILIETAGNIARAFYDASIATPSLELNLKKEKKR